MANGTGQSAAVKTAPAKPEPDWQDYKPGEQGWEDYSPAAGAGAGTVAEPKRGAFERFGRSLRESMGFEPEGTAMGDIRQIGQGIKQEFSHPINSAKLLWEDMNKEEQGLIDKAYTEQHSPDLSTKAKGYVRGAYSAIPFLGPALSRAGDEATEGNYAGMAGTMAGTAGMLSDDMAAAGMRAPIEKGIQATRRGVATGVRAAPEVGGAIGGYAAGASMGHPYIGAYAGAKVGRALRKPAEGLARAIEGEKPGPVGPLTGDIRQHLAPGAGSRIGGPWLPSADNEAAASSKASPGTRTLRGDLKFEREGTTSTGAPSTGEMPKQTEPVQKSVTRYPIRNKAQQAAAAKREAAGRTTFSAGPSSTAPAREASPVPPKGQDLPSGGPDWTEEVRRRAPGVSPERKSLRRQMEKTDIGDTREQGARLKRKIDEAESRRQAKRGAAASENE